MRSMRNTGDKAYMKDILAVLFAVYMYLTYLDFITANPDGKKLDSKGRELPCNPFSLSDCIKYIYFFIIALDISSSLFISVLNLLGIINCFLI